MMYPYMGFGFLIQPNHRYIFLLFINTMAIIFLFTFPPNYFIFTCKIPSLEIKERKPFLVHFFEFDHSSDTLIAASQNEKSRQSI